MKVNKTGAGKDLPSQVPGDLEAKITQSFPNRCQLITLQTADITQRTSLDKQLALSPHHTSNSFTGVMGMY